MGFCGVNWLASHYLCRHSGSASCTLLSDQISFLHQLSSLRKCVDSSHLLFSLSPSLHPGGFLSCYSATRQNNSLGQFQRENEDKCLCLIHSSPEFVEVFRPLILNCIIKEEIKGVPPKIFMRFYTKLGGRGGEIHSFVSSDS